MKISYPKINTLIEVEEGDVYSLVIENQKLMYDFTKDLYIQSKNLDGEIILSKNDKIIPISKNIEIIDEYFNFDLLNKNILNKAISKLGAVAIDQTYYEKTCKLLSDIERFTYDISSELDLDITVGNFDIGGILKALHINVDFENSEISNSIYSYMKAVRELDKDKLFVFINFKMYISEEERLSFYDTVSKHDYKVLLIDGKVYPKLENEKLLIIDESLCEF